MSASTHGRRTKLGAALMAAVAMCCGGIAGGAPQAAFAEESPVDTTATLLGSYLAARVARSEHDNASAALFYREAMKQDPDDTSVLENSFLVEAAEGNLDRSTELATRLVEAQENHRLAQLWLTAVAVKKRDFPGAEAHLAHATGGGPIGELTTALALAWIKLAEGDSAGALDALHNARVADGAQTYIRFHRALISDLSGHRGDADKEFDTVFKLDPRTPRLALAYAQHAASAGDLKLARSILKAHLEKVGGDGQPMIRALQSQLAGNEVIPLLIESPEQGFVEVFYGLGEALASEGGIGLGSIYLQMALMIRDNSAFTLAALANVYELTQRYDQAIATYDRIPKNTALQKAIEVRKAVNLNLLDRVEDAKEVLERLAAQQPDDYRPLVTLGDIMRARKRHAEAVEYYSRVIAMTPKPEQRHWIYWYARGTSYERLKKWTLAETDLLRALQLAPDQPLVLNYLGYTWIDQNRNLKQGMAMIEKAVAAKPDDGYIVDSLGWAHFRLGDFKDAARYLERAVELRPEDPVLNDHLGDAYWRIGRQREARFQWEQSLSLKPEPEDADKINLKVRQGLPALASAPPPRATKKSREAKSDVPRRRVDSQNASPFQ